MVELVKTEEAKTRLRIDFADDDALVAELVSEATDIIIDYLKKPDHGWTEETVPYRVKAAILLVTGSLYENREAGEEVLTSNVRDLIHRDRDPALA